MSVGAWLETLHAVIVRIGVLAGSVIIALGLFGSSAALAQNCGPLIENGVAHPGIDLNVPFAAALAGSTAVSAAISASNAAFLAQSTAFVSAPANPRPDSEGAGIWFRDVGGELTLNSGSQVGVSLGQATASKTCDTQFHQTYGGFQLGADMAKLNVGGWNLTLGPTAGFLQTNGSIVGGDGSPDANFGSGYPLNATTQAPFVGMYGMATYGNFFVDGLVRADYFQTVLNSPAANMFNEKIDAHGFTLAASSGYNWKIPNSSWFVEPSAGMIWSREAVDPLNVANPVLPSNLLAPGQSNILLSGAAQVNDIESIIGRAGLRVGTTLERGDIVYSPFAAASVWHDFGSRVTADWTTCPGCLSPGVPTASASLSSSNIGTFGQYSVGVSGQLKNSGWIGFARVDYRDGADVHGLSGSGGIRYQFNPTAAALPVKTKASADVPVNWTGWYGGLVGGATEFGDASQTFQGVPGAFLGPSTANMRPSGWLGGGTLGYNYQTGKWVVGVEGDVAGTSTNGSTPCAPLAVNPNTFLGALQNTTCSDSLDWIATATARLGYAWTPRSLLYVKAGAAFTDEKASAQCNFGSTTTNIPGSGTVNVPGVSGQAVEPLSCVDPTLSHFISQASTSAFRTGWTLGIGSEFALTNQWSIKGEFDWLDFGSKALILSDGTPFNSTLHVAEAKIGLNYKFWPAGAADAGDWSPLPAIKAQPLPLKASPAQVSTWDGFYVGGSVGWEQTASDWNTTCFSVNGLFGTAAFNENCGSPGNLTFVDASSPHTFETSGARVGAYLGNNWQVAPTWLVGVEADIGFNDKTSTTTGVVGCAIYCSFTRAPFLTTSAFDSTSIRTSWDGSFRGRAGYLVTPTFLVYGTGGFAERVIDATVTCNGNFSPRCFDNESETFAGHLQAGWTVGAGIEWKVVNDVLVRGEYRYSDYGSWSPTFFAGTLDEIRTNISSQTQMALFGVSYLFGGTPVK
jgi:outer membrane autotransporter protein